MKHFKNSPERPECLRSTCAEKAQLQGAIWRALREGSAQQKASEEVGQEHEVASYR